jgi:hypothetical protein
MGVGTKRTYLEYPSSFLAPRKEAKEGATGPRFL